MLRSERCARLRFSKVLIRALYYVIRALYYSKVLIIESLRSKCTSALSLRMYVFRDESNTPIRLISTGLLCRGQVCNAHVAQFDTLQLCHALRPDVVVSHVLCVCALCCVVCVCVCVRARARA